MEQTDHKLLSAAIVGCGIVAILVWAFIKKQISGIGVTGGLDPATGKVTGGINITFAAPPAAGLVEQLADVGAVSLSRTTFFVPSGVRSRGDEQGLELAIRAARIHGATIVRSVLK